jgi:hypothetical protein
MLHRSLALALVASSAFAAIGCAEQAPPPQRRSAPATPEKVETGRGKPATQPLKPAAAERVVVAKVSWPALDQIDRGIRARFDGETQRRIDTAGVPVLAPRESSVYAQVAVIAKPQWFTMAMKDAAYAQELAERKAGRRTPPAPGEGGLSVYVQGNSVAHRYPHIAPATGRHTVRGHSAFITRNEAIWSATWEENGVSYVVEVECSRPDDPRCETEDVLVDVVEKLVFVGGAGPVAATPDRALPVEVQR